MIQDAYRMAEVAANLIEAQIKANIADALQNIRDLQTDGKVTTEPPRDYFQYEDAIGYRAPVVFTIVRGINVRNSEMAANHINALDDILVAVVVEDRVKSRVTTKAYRYQAALMQVLHLASLTSADSATKLFVRAKEFNFSGIADIKNENDQTNIFRKEVSLSLDVEHIENLVVN